MIQNCNSPYDRPAFRPDIAGLSAAIALGRAEAQGIGALRPLPPFDITVYQTIHNVGGTAMGRDQATPGLLDA